MRRALICGISGQDGAYLAKFLLAGGYEVFGTSRDASVAEFHNLKRLGIHRSVKTLSMAVNDFRSVLQVFRQVDPHEVYNLAGQTSVALSFEQPVEAMQSISSGTLNCLEAIRFLDANIRFYNASSSECFGDTGGVAANENTSFKPRSPYAVAKCAAHWQVANYREAYGIFACNGILFNHESCLRPERFVTQKIVASARRIAAGSDEKLVLGNTAIIRDWGWAPEYVEAMHGMLRMDKPDDYVIATGHSISLENFVEMVFSHLNLNWHDHVNISPALLRPTDLAVSRSDPGKAAKILGWRAQYHANDIARMMVEKVYD